MITLARKLLPLIALWHRWSPARYLLILKLLKMLFPLLMYASCFHCLIIHLSDRNCKFFISLLLKTGPCFISDFNDRALLVAIWLQNIKRAIYIRVSFSAFGTKTWSIYELSAFLELGLPVENLSLNDKILVIHAPGRNLVAHAILKSSLKHSLFMKLRE